MTNINLLLLCEILQLGVQLCHFRFEFVSHFDYSTLHGDQFSDGRLKSSNLFLCTCLLLEKIIGLLLHLLDGQFFSSLYLSCLIAFILNFLEHAGNIRGSVGKIVQLLLRSLLSINHFVQLDLLRFSLLVELLAFTLEIINGVLLSLCL